MMDDFNEQTRRLLYLEEQVNRLQAQMLAGAADAEMRARQLEYQLGTLGVENFKDSMTTDLKFYKNLCFNSSFERGTGTAADFWTGGTQSTAASWDSSTSLRLTPNQTATQTDPAAIDPSVYQRKKTWVAFVHKFGAVRVRVFNRTLTTVLATRDFPYAADWPDGKARFTFEPGTVTGFRVQFQNIGTTDAFIDAVQIEPDWKGKWPSIYSNGPNSDPLPPVVPPVPPPRLLAHFNVGLFFESEGFNVLNVTDLQLNQTFYNWTDFEWSPSPMIRWKLEANMAQGVNNPNRLVVKLTSVGTPFNTYATLQTPGPGISGTFETPFFPMPLGQTLCLRITNASTTITNILYMARLVAVLRYPN